MSKVEVFMADNFLNLNTNLNKPFGFKLPERTIKQVKDSALNLLKGVVKPLTEIGMGKEQILDGTVEKQIISYQKIINSVNTNMNAVDKYAYKSLDVKT